MRGNFFCSFKSGKRVTFVLEVLLALHFFLFLFLVYSGTLSAVPHNTKEESHKLKYNSLTSFWLENSGMPIDTVPKRSGFDKNMQEDERRTYLEDMELKMASYIRYLQSSFEPQNHPQKGLCIVPIIFHIPKEISNGTEISAIEELKYASALARTLQTRSVKDNTCAKTQPIIVVFSENEVHTCNVLLSNILKMPSELCSEQNFKFRFFDMSQDVETRSLILWESLMIMVKKLHSPFAFYSMILQEKYGLNPVELSSDSSISDCTLIPVPQGSWHNFLIFGGLSTKSLRSWNKPEVQLHLLTYNRPRSFERLLYSLTRADYLGDPVSMTIHVDAGASDDTMELVYSLSDDYNQNPDVQADPALVWSQGPISVHKRWMKAGLMVAVIESWYPISNDEYAIILEDDIEVSPLFYVWAKWSLLAYRYSDDPGQDSLYYNRIFGISLYTPKVHEIPMERKSFSPDIELLAKGHEIGTPFLFQVPCSWGAVYFPEFWREFLEYVQIRDPLAELQEKNEKGKDYKHKVFIPKSISNFWLKSWKKYMIEMIVLRAYLMLYPNFSNQTSFSTNHVELGTHMNPFLRQKMLKEFEVDLVADPKPLDMEILPSKSQFLFPKFIIRNNKSEQKKSIYDLSNNWSPMPLKKYAIIDLLGNQTSKLSKLIDYGKELGKQNPICKETNGGFWKRLFSGKIKCLNLAE